MKAHLLFNLFVSVLLVKAGEINENIAASWTLYISTRFRNFNLIPSAYAFARSFYLNPCLPNFSSVFKT